MKILKRFIQLLVLLPIGIVIVSLAVANRHIVQLALDPLSPEQPALEYQLPLSAIIFGALIVGIIIGGVATWLKQGRNRKAARENRYEAKKWRNEADRQQKRIEKMAEKGGQSVPSLPAPGNDDAAKPAA